MNQRDNILQELNELNSSLTNAAAANVYTVPAGYFENLSELVLNRIKALAATSAAEELSYLSPVLSGLSKEMLFSLPSGYFEGLEKNILNTVTESHDYMTAKEEIESLSPLLGGLKKEMPVRQDGHPGGPFTVPDGYFETLTPAIRDENTGAKVISLTHRKWFRYAAAAVVTGLFILGGFFAYKNNSKEQGGKALAKFTKDVKKMNESQKEIVLDFIDAGLSTEETAKNTDKVKKEIQELLQDIPEDELTDFNKQSEDLQDVLMTN